MPDKNTKKTVVILQPGYLPWLGFFDLLHKADTFVIFDDVQYTTRDWRNRNRIKTQHGPLWYTVPLIARGVRNKIVRDVEIDNSTAWQKKQLRGFMSYYRKAKHFNEIMEVMGGIYDHRYTFLIDIDMDFINRTMQYLSLERTVLFSSELRTEGAKDEKLLSICRSLNATHYLSGTAAMNYLRESIFIDKGIAVEWHNYRHPYYNQLWLREQGFISHLSVLDLLFNHGQNSLDILTGKKTVSQPEEIHCRNANTA